MASNSQPPPRDIPLSVRKNPEVASYEQRQMDALYQLWVLTQQIPGLTTPYPISDGGTGASTAADARDNLGVGVFPRPYAVKSADYTITTDDYMINVDTSGVTITLPTSVGSEGRDFVIKNTSGGNITLDADGTETIDGSLTQVFGSMTAITVLSDNANWLII